MEHDERERRDWPHQDAPTEPVRRADPNAPPAGSPSEIEGWPSQDAGSGDAARGSDARWQAEPPPPSEVEAHPAAAAPAPPVTSREETAAHVVPAAESTTGESTQCPRCGTENRPGLAFCRNCGQRLVAAGVASTVQRPGAPEGSTACPRCGTHNRAGVAFCQNCGANLRGTGAGYVPPAVAEETPSTAETGRRGALLGPIVLLIGVIGLITGYLLPFAYGTGSLFERAFGPNGYGAAFWAGYPEVNAALADQAYFGLAAPIPFLGALLVALAVAGFMRADPGVLQKIGLGVALLWSVALVLLFVVVELLGNWGGDVVGLLRELSPAGIIFFLAGLIVVIGTLTRLGRS